MFVERRFGFLPARFRFGPGAGFAVACGRAWSHPQLARPYGERRVHHSPLDVECNDLLGVVPQPGWRTTQHLLVGRGYRFIPWRHRSGPSAPRRGRRHPDRNYRVAEAHPGRGPGNGGRRGHTNLGSLDVSCGRPGARPAALPARELQASRGHGRWRGSRSGCRKLQCGTRGISIERMAKELARYLRGRIGYFGNTKRLRRRKALKSGPDADCGR